jgi:hypothetical protein
MAKNLPEIAPLPLAVGVLVLYNLFVLPLTTSLLSFGIGLIAYSITKSLILVLVILAIAPLLILSERVHVERFADTTDDATKISERVKAMKEQGKVVPQETTGVLESQEVANFQDINAPSTDVSGAPATPDSIPAFVREKGRLLLVPEHSVERLENKEVNPREQRVLQNGEDTEGVNTALVPDATQLPEPATAAASKAPSM